MYILSSKQVLALNLFATTKHHLQGKKLSWFVGDPTGGRSTRHDYVLEVVGVCEGEVTDQHKVVLRSS
jgi:hypothetical protein